MKGITGNSVLDAYQRMAVTRVDKARAPDQTEAASANRQAGTPAAEVTISARAHDLAVEREAPVDTRKVESLKDQIKQNSFVVNSQVIAERMLNSAAA